MVPVIERTSTSRDGRLARVLGGVQRCACEAVRGLPPTGLPSSHHGRIRGSTPRAPVAAVDPIRRGTPDQPSPDAGARARCRDRNASPQKGRHEEHDVLLVGATGRLRAAHDPGCPRYGGSCEPRGHRASLGRIDLERMERPSRHCQKLGRDALTLTASTWSGGQSDRADALRGRSPPLELLVERHQRVVVLEVDSPGRREVSAEIGVVLQELPIELGQVAIRSPLTRYRTWNRRLAPAPVPRAARNAAKPRLRGTACEWRETGSRASRLAGTGRPRQTQPPERVFPVPRHARSTASAPNFDRACWKASSTVTEDAGGQRLLVYEAEDCPVGHSVSVGLGSPLRRRDVGPNGTPRKKMLKMTGISTSPMKAGIPPMPSCGKMNQGAVAPAKRLNPPMPKMIASVFFSLPCKLDGMLHAQARRDSARWPSRIRARSP